MSCLKRRTTFLMDRSLHLLNRGRRTTRLWDFFPYLVDVSRPDVPFIMDHPQIAGCINSQDLLTEESNWPRGLDTPACEEHRHALRHVAGDPPFLEPELSFGEVGFQIADKQRWLARHGYDGRVVRVES
jgi:hypothetical protein